MFNKNVLMILIVFISFTKAELLVLENNSRNFTFEYSLEEFRIKDIEHQQKTFSFLEFPGSDEYGIDKNGNRLPYKSFIVGIPQDGKAEIYLEPLESKVIKLEKPLFKFSDINNKLPHNGSWLTEKEIIYLRGLKAAKFYISPFKINSNGSSVTVLLKAKISVKYDGQVVSSRKVKEKGPYEDILKGLILNYETAGNFRAERKRSFLTRSPLTSIGNMIKFTVGDGVRGQNETSTKENGIMKVTASDIRNQLGSSIPITSVSVYGAQREELSLKVPSAGSIPTGVQSIPVMRFDLNNNTLFDGDDYILFYVTGLCDWVVTKDTVSYYDTDSNIFIDSVTYGVDFNLNRLADKRTFWITTDGSSSSISKALISDSVALDTVKSVLLRNRYREVTRYLSGNSAKADTEGGIDWVWDRLTESNRDFSFDTDLDYSLIDTSIPGMLRVVKAYDSNDTLLIRFGNSILTHDFNGISKISTWPLSSNPNRGTIDISLESNTNNNRAFFEIDYIDLHHFSPLYLDGDKPLSFFSDTLAGVKGYSLSRFNAGKSYIFRIAENGSSVDLIDTIVKSAMDSVTDYVWLDSTGMGYQYFLLHESMLLSLPADNELVSYKNNDQYQKKLLRNQSISSDYLIITSDDFISQAVTLAEHKASSNLFSHPSIVDVEDIYREFSGGTPDFVAIRNFLSHIHNGGWLEAPDYVLFLGAGHYDYKNYSKKGNKIHVPTCQYNGWCVEDFFTYLDSGDVIGNKSTFSDLFLGRIVAYNENEAASAVSKIIETESEGSDFSDWRNKLLLVADDDRTPHGVDGITHYLSSEIVLDYSKYKRPSLSSRKVYLFEYPWNSIGYKPQAFSALESEINSGVGFVNYFGHGSWTTWADENILNKDNVKSLVNKGRYPVITAFSCHVGRFDIPDETSLAGDMVNQENSGAIAFIASTRTAFAGSNTSMAKGFFWALYDKENNYSIGQAYALSKIKVTVHTDITTKADTLGRDLKYYALIGDPSFRINRVTDSLKVTIESEKEDTIQALESVIVKGQVGTFDSTGGYNINSSFGASDDNKAFAQIGFYFPTRDSVKRKDGGENTSITYSLPGEYLRPDTTVPVINGEFSVDISIPKRVPFDQEKPLLRVYAFDEKGTKTALMIKDDFIFSGSKSSNNVDSVGPSITIRPVYLDTNDIKNSQWTAPIGIGDTITATLPMVLGIDLWDQDGIQLSGSTPGEGLSLEIEGILPKTLIENAFSIDPDSKGTSGSTEYFIDSSGVRPGVYNVIVGAMDINGNISRKEVSLRVTTRSELDLSNVFNYPNPAVLGKSTRFYFNHNRMIESEGENINATIRIYSLSGKLLKIFRNAQNGQQWDLRDQIGNRLSPNVYLYTVTAEMKMSDDYSEEDKKVKSSIKKLVIHPSR